MARRTINSPGVEIAEVDFSLRTPSGGGTNVYITGFADQGPTDEVINVTSITEFTNIFGAPKNPAERYFFHTVKAALNSSAVVSVNRLPYGADSGQGFGDTISVLAYPASAVGSSTFDVASGTYLVGKPTQFTITQQQYLDITSNNGFNWSSTPSTVFNSVNSLSGAAFIVVNKGQTTIDGKFQGYYLGLADNTNINPASAYDAIKRVETATLSAPSTGLTSYTTIPGTRLAFALTATPEFGDNPARNSLSQVMEESIVGYDISTRDFDDTLNVGVFKLRQSVFANDASVLDYVLEENYNGSIGYFRQINAENGGLPVNFSLENVENESRNIEILVNPFISDKNAGIKLKADGTPMKKIRLITDQLITAVNSGVSPDITGVASSAQITAAATLLGKADALFPLGSYTSTATTNKLIGQLPDKLTRALDRIKNDEIYNFDVIPEAGLGTIWTIGNTGSFDDTAYSADVEALRTSNTPSNTTAVNRYNTIASKFVTFCGPIKDGGRGDIIFIADPIRQILVSGKQTKVIDEPNRNFTQHIYWPLRHQFSNINSSYATTFANYMKVYDEFSGLYVYVPPSGYIAAKMASTDASDGPWTAPAGFNRGIINDVLDIAIAPNQRQRDELYKVSLNPIARFPDQGVVVFGQKTLLKKPSAFDRINVRRAFLYLEKITKSTMKFFIFENNTLFTRTRVLNTLNPFFERVRAADGITDFLIVCDDRNNNAEVIDNNELVVDIYIRPVRTAEFILVNFYATRSDTRFEEIIGG
jgi:hypothetical protein